MKFNKHYLLIILLVFSNSFAQQESIIQRRAKKEDINKIPATKEELRDSTYQFYVNDINLLKKRVDEKYKNRKQKKATYYNNAVLNNHFKEIITSYASSTGDVSFNDYFLNANSSERTLSLGGSFRVDNAFRWSKPQVKAIREIKPVQKLRNLISMSVRTDYSNGFANLYSQDSETQEFNFNSNIGVGITYTHVLKGTIKAADTDKIKYIRDSVVSKKMIEKIQKYVDESYDQDLRVDNYGITDEATKKQNEKDLIVSKFFEFYKEILDEELKHAKEEHLIGSSRVTWFNLGVYLPATAREVLHSVDSVAISKSNFRDFRADVTANVLWSGYANNIFRDYSFKLTGKGSLFNTNTFIANNDTARSFQNVIQDNGSTIVEGDASNVFLGDYNEFIATSLKGEMVFLLFKNTVGLSGAVEYIFGDVENTNWKLGIPLSFKDKEGKPTINFELQWREINTSHSVGISVGYNFGKFVN